MNEHPKAVKSDTYTVAEAKARFSELLARAAAGEELRITRHGKPYAVIGPVAVEKPKLPRVGAFADVPLVMADDFDELGPEWDEYVK
jgi:prevent-host-death family protein